MPDGDFKFIRVNAYPSESLCEKASQSSFEVIYAYY